MVHPNGNKIHQPSLQGVLTLTCQIQLSRSLWFKSIAQVLNWLLATLWLTDKLSQSAQAYKHAFLDRPAGCPSTTVVKKKPRNVATLFSKTTVRRCGAVCIEPWLPTRVVLSTLLVEVGGDICLLARGQFSWGKFCISRSYQASNQLPHRSWQDRLDSVRVMWCGQDLRLRWTLQLSVVVSFGTVLYFFHFC